VDSSLLGSEDSLSIAGLILRRVFHHNIRHLTDAGGPSVRCLAVLEEAQTVLGDRHLDDSNIFVRWVKEGRKYGLGAIIVTQQPGAISDQIISQGDNFFALHLLNDEDLQTLQRHNAYYTDEIVNYLRAEPIVGNCYFWSAPSQPFVVPVRVCSFEVLCAKPSVEPRAEPPAKLTPVRIAQAVKDALAGDNSVWLYPIQTLCGQAGSGWIAFSVEYLLAAVTRQVNAGGRSNDDQTRLADEIAKVLARHKARRGYAMLSGRMQRVWAIPQVEIKLTKSKTMRSLPVEVRDTM
jgi:hypothetical protein